MKTEFGEQSHSNSEDTKAKRLSLNPARRRLVTAALFKLSKSCGVVGGMISAFNCGINEQGTFPDITFASSHPLLPAANLPCRFYSASLEY